MRLVLTITSQQNIRLPLAHHHILQSFIYSLLSHNKEFSQRIHDKDSNRDRPNFKFFSFSQLYGKYQIINKEIIFTPPIYLEISTIDSDLCQNLLTGVLLFKEAKLGMHKVFINHYRVLKEQLAQSSYHIQMISPITVHSTQNKHTKFFNPLETDFEEALNSNFRRKYKAFYNKHIEDTFTIKPLDFSLKNKIVTIYKNYYITAWKGKYELTGDPYILNFLYKVGLGEKNSMGFGLFKIISKKGK
ncbi:CRISPR-associated endoribonuclease Cas6 [Streptococcus sp. sy018]|uniref:CRISPR-associated endoribonuclease Cas6 n=1 Tax=Streptococcus sp. sy018 TaxID=2600147 RepID=UPI0011B84765|nr:CRISPR-associated endoribonuclease Cas6 [Streptococcus sp. sy018]TWS95553.1 CRISPR-associated endoribonuclease Cas6 [Streptococcus sp. sy018]